jgi:predicted RNA binding protein YcfA (HicA-like mRNA interferase family)
MGKEKGAAMTPLRVREVRRFLESAGYSVVPGKHKHLKFTHPAKAAVLLPLQPQSMLSLSAARQIAGALGYSNANGLVEAVQGRESGGGPSAS